MGVWLRATELALRARMARAHVLRRGRQQRRRLGDQHRGGHRRAPDLLPGLQRRRRAEHPGFRVLPGTVPSVVPVTATGGSRASAAESRRSLNESHRHGPADTGGQAASGTGSRVSVRCANGSLRHTMTSMRRRCWRRRAACSLILAAATTWGVAFALFNTRATWDGTLNADGSIVTASSFGRSIDTHDPRRLVIRGNGFQTGSERIDYVMGPAIWVAAEHSNSSDDPRHVSRAGWPLPCMRFEWTDRRTDPNGPNARLVYVADPASIRGAVVTGEPELLYRTGRSWIIPYAPIPVFFLLNSTLFSLLGFIALSLPGQVARHVRRRANRCPTCGYDLTSITNTCPECGTSTNPAW